MTPARPRRKLNPRLTRLRRLLVKQLAAEGIVSSHPGIACESYIDITHREIGLLLGISERTVTTYVGGKPQKSGTGRR